MPRDFITLADVREPTFTIVCEPCGRRGRYNVQRLITKHGADMKLPDLKVILAIARRRARSASTTAARRSTKGFSFRA
jgi:hypothetical protein